LLVWGLVIYARTNFILDPRNLVAVGAIFYLGLGPLSERLFIDYFSDEVFRLAVLCACLGSCGLVLSSILWRPVNHRCQVANNDIKPNRELIKYIAIVLVLAGYFFMVINYNRVGGLLTAISISRIERMALLSEERFNLPFIYFFITGFSLYVYNLIIISDIKKIIYQKKTEILILVVLFLPVLLFWLLEGERSNIIKILLPAIAMFLYKYSHRISIKGALVVIALFLAFSFIGNVRASVSYSVLTQSIEPIKEQMKGVSLGWFIPREFAANFLSITATVGIHNEKRFGMTYINSLIGWLPRSIYPGKKPLSLSHELGDVLSASLDRERRLGIGYSPVSEAYLNFGISGPLIVLFVFGVVSNLYSKLILLNRHIIKLFYFISLPLLIIYYRASVSSIISYLAYTTMILIGCSLMYISMKSLRLVIINNKTSE